MKYILKLNKLFFLVIWQHPKNIIEQVSFSVKVILVWIDIPAEITEVISLLIILVVLISFVIIVVIGEWAILVVLISFAIVVEILNFSFSIHGGL